MRPVAGQGCDLTNSLRAAELRSALPLFAILGLLCLGCELSMAVELLFLLLPVPESLPPPWWQW